MQKVKIQKYISKEFKGNKFSISEIKGDASNRKYYRAISKKRKLIIMDSSLEKRNYNNFLKFTKIFENKKIRVPEIFYKNLDKKILVMEDLGNNLIYDKVNKNNFFKIY